MKSSVDKLEDNRVRLTVSVTATEADEAVAEAYARTARKLKIPGFRPGKAPRPIIDRHVGRDAVLADALEQLIEATYPRALDELRLRPISRPDTGELDLLEEGSDYTYHAEVDVRPELTLSSTDGLKALVPPSRTTDEEIDAQIEYLRDRFATLGVVEDRGVAEGDYVLLSFTGTVDGELADDLSVDKYLYEMGRGIMPPEFDAALIGAKPGEKVSVSFTVPDSASNPAYVGKTASFDIDVHEVKAKFLPTPDDEFAASVGGFDTVAELREDIRTKLDENKAAAHDRLVEREAVADLVTRLEGEVPAELVSSRAASMTDDFFDSLKERGLTMPEYTDATGVTTEQIQADIAREAEARVRDELALEALFRAVGLEYRDDELEAEIVKLATEEKVAPEQMRDRLVSSGVMALLRERLQQRAALRWLMEHVEIVERAPDGAGAEAETAATPATSTRKKPASAAKKPASAAKKAAPAAGAATKKGTSTKKPATKKAGGAKEG